MQFFLRALTFALLALISFGGFVANAQEKEEAEKKEKPDYPTLDKVTKGYEEVDFTSVTEDSKPFMRVWQKQEEGQLLAMLPRDYASEKHRQFIATTVSGGTIFAGLQTEDHYVYWKKYGKRLALIRKDISIRGSDPESKASIKRIFTDTVLLDVPILTIVPRGGPVIDLDSLLVKNASTFFPGRLMGDSKRVNISKPHLTQIIDAKIFSKNIEIGFEATNFDGELIRLHYSISKNEGTAGYKPRVADQRIGYFTTDYDDFGKYDGDGTAIRYINRWNIEKRDPALRLSPPKKQIVFYLEHTTPVRYRRWVRDGVLYWNKAFEQIGIDKAIVVRQQDKETNQYMDLDPEDVQYNFIRWLNNDISTAIGPSRVNPLTGEILDADIVLTDGWIRAFESQFENVMPKIMTQGMTPETLAWFAQHPNWDPRLRLAPPSQRDFILQSLEHQAKQAYAGHPETKSTQGSITSDYSAVTSPTGDLDNACLAAEGREFDVALMRMAITLMRNADDDKDEDDEESEDGEDKENDEPKEQMLDGMPESFIGPLLADLVCHEVGHTLGLRHNFKASAIYTLAEMNSEEVKGKKPFCASVMDYNPVNFNFESGSDVQGDYAMIGVGPYDMWAIEYGYTFDEKKLPEILSRVAEPQLGFCSDEDTGGPDPLARRYDFTKNPLDYAKSQVALANHHRERILEDFVEDGDSWNKARKGYLLTLSLQTRSTSMMSNWIGGAFVNRDKKGDPEDRKPIEVVDAKVQRDAFNFVVENTFDDGVYGLSPELLAHMTKDSWGFSFGASGEAAWPVHDQIMGLQASRLSQLMNPTTLRRVYDNEFRVPSDEDAFTLNELMATLNESIWSELDEKLKGKFSERKPAISSLRRNLQTEYLERLFDLANTTESRTAAMKPISNLAAMTLKELAEKLEKASELDNLDAYTKAHLVDSHDRVQRWIEGVVITK